MLSVVAGGGIIAAIVGFWGQFKNFLSKIISIVVKTDKFSFQSDFFILSVLTLFKSVDFGNSNFVSRYEHLKSKNSVLPIIFEAPKSGFFLYNKILLYVNFKDKKISYLRGTFNPEEFSRYYAELLTSHIQSDSGTSFFFTKIKGKNTKDIYQNTSSPVTSDDKEDNLPYHFDSSDPWSITNFVLQKATSINKINFSPDDIGFSKEGGNERIFFTEEAKEVNKEVSIWVKNRSWFLERNIPHSRGILLYGKPGTGKSQVIKEVCVKNELPLYSFDLASLNNWELESKIAETIRPCAILFEDLDSIFDGRKNLHENSVSFDCFINELSGAGSKDGIFFFFTTNNIDKLDSALIRPGRADRAFEIGYLPFEGKKFLANKILKDWPEEIEKVLSLEGDHTGAEFENICIQKAIHNFWNK